MIIKSQIETPAGPMTVCSVPEGICMLSFDGINTVCEIEFLKNHFKTEFREGEDGHIKQLKNELNAYFSGAGKAFSVPLAPPGTPFQKAVWDELMRTGYGTTRTYHEQASAMGKPGAIRAVANANGMNRIAIVIPCHRIIGSDGSLTGYAGGLDRKRWLLGHERKHSGKEYNQQLF